MNLALSVLVQIEHPELLLDGVVVVVVQVVAEDRVFLHDHDVADEDHAPWFEQTIATPAVVIVVVIDRPCAIS